MTWKILVPLDGTTASNRALPWASALARDLGAAVQLSHVQEYAHSLLPGLAHSSAAAAEIEGTLEQAKASFYSKEDVSVAVLEGDPGSILAEQARESYDLVVMASELRGGLARIGHPSVAWSVIRDSGTPVLVIPHHAPPTPPRPARRVIVPLDGSETSMLILSHIAPLARTLHWLVVLLGIVPTSPSATRDALATQAYLGHLAADMHRQLVATRSVVRSGEPGPAILELARAANADLIAMSTHSQRGGNPLRVGSVTEYVLAHATTPVLTFHPNAVEFFESPAEAAPSRRFSERLLTEIRARQPRPK